LKKTSKLRLSAKKKLPANRKRRHMDGFAALHEYFYGLTSRKRERFVKECDSSLNSIQQVISRKVVGPGLAKKIELASKRRITQDMLCNKPKATPRDWTSDKRRVKPGRDTPGFAAFRAFINAKTPAEREEFAKACDVTVHHLQKMLVRRKSTYETAVKIEKGSEGEITRDMLCPNWQEKFQIGPKMSFAFPPGQDKKKGGGRKYADSRVDADRDTPGYAAFRAYFNALEPIARRKFADECETTVDYLRLVLNRGRMSAELALKIERASVGEITRDMLYPDWKSIWPEWKPPQR